MSGPLRGLCSKAPARLLDDLAAVPPTLGAGATTQVHFAAAGGVDVARRVRAGERADLVVLDDDVVRGLDEEGLLVAGSRTPLFLSDTVLGVRDGAAVPALATVDDLVRVVRDAASVGCSTGPSGRELRAWLERAGLAEEVGPRLVQATPGVPVARLVADGRCDVGLQQRSEMASTPGVVVVGPLPDGAAITSTFTGAVLATSERPDDAAQALAALASSEVAAVVERHGMRTAPP